MPTMAELIEAHRSAASQFNIVSNMLRRNEAELAALDRGCSVPVLLKRIPGAPDHAVTTNDPDDMRRQIDAFYQKQGTSLYWLKTHCPPLFDQAADLLDGLRATNLALIAPAFTAWQAERQRNLQAWRELQTEWDRLGAIETKAHRALFACAADAGEETQRRDYANRAKITAAKGFAQGQALEGIDEQKQEAKPCAA